MKRQHRSVSFFQLSLLAWIFLVIAASVSASAHADRRAFRTPTRTKQEPILAPDQPTSFTGEFDAGINASPPAVDTLASEFGFVEIFKKLFGGTGEEQEEAPTTSEQRRSAWQEEERHAEFAFCSDVGFRGLHP